MSFIQMLRQNRELLPLVTIVCAGCTLGVGALLRVATVHPEVSLDHKNNPNPYLGYQANSNKCFKVLQVTDYDKRRKENPPAY